MDNRPEPTTIDEYLDQICSRMKALRPADMEELRQEFRLHLETLITSTEASGSSHEEAFQIALTRFGSSKQIAQEISQVSLKLQRLQFTKLFLRFALGIMPFALCMGFVSYALSNYNDPIWQTDNNWSELFCVGSIIAIIEVGFQWGSRCLEMRLERSNTTENLAIILPSEFIRNLSSAFLRYVPNAYRTYKLTWRDFINVAFWFIGSFVIKDMFFKAFYFVAGVETTVSILLFIYVQRLQLKKFVKS